MTPPNHVAELRKSQGWLAWKFAKKAGICDGTLHRIETHWHRRRPRQTTQRKIVLALGLPWSRRAEVFPR